MLRLKDHAILRMTERSTITEDELLQQLNEGKYIKVGEEGKTYRAHWLFYQKREQLWYVVVVDERTEEIITLLPPDYRCAFAMDLELLDEARELAEDPPPVKPTLPQTTPGKPKEKISQSPSSQKEQEAPSVYKLKASVHLPGTNYPTWKHVASYPIQTGDPRKDLKTQAFCQHVAKDLFDRGIPQTCDGSLMITMRNKRSTPIQIPLWVIYGVAKQGIQ